MSRVNFVGTNSSGMPAVIPTSWPPPRWALPSPLTENSPVQSVKVYRRRCVCFWGLAASTVEIQCSGGREVRKVPFYWVFGRRNRHTAAMGDFFWFFDIFPKYIVDD